VEAVNNRKSYGKKLQTDILPLRSDDGFSCEISRSVGQDDAVHEQGE
jgi:hypothetical protein